MPSFYFEDYYITSLLTTPSKIINPNYEKIPLPPLDMTLRRKVGRNLRMDELNKAGNMVQEMLRNSSDYRKEILTLRAELFPQYGHSAEIGGRYILQQLIQRKQRRK